MLCRCFPPGDDDDDDDDDDEASAERNVAAVSPVPKIVTTDIREDFGREGEDGRDALGETDEPLGAVTDSYININDDNNLSCSEFD